MSSKDELIEELQEENAALNYYNAALEEENLRLKEEATNLREVVKALKVVSAEDVDLIWPSGLSQDS